jgi:hypothetical protein
MLAAPQTIVAFARPVKIFQHNIDAIQRAISPAAVHPCLTDHIDALPPITSVFVVGSHATDIRARRDFDAQAGKRATQFPPGGARAAK